MKSEKGLMHLLIAAEVIVLIVVILFGVVKRVTEPDEQKEVEISTQENQIEELPENTEEVVMEVMPSETEEATIEVTFSEEVEVALSAMTLEEKVAQLFIVSPETLTGADRVTIAGTGTRNALGEYPVGGILYARENYLGQVQMRDLIRGAQAMSDEQSGRYLFAGTLVEIGEEMIIASVSAGQEEAMAGLIATEDLSANQDIEDMEHIFYVQELEQLSEEKEAEKLYCYNVINGGPSAVEAITGGADMLCVTDGFFAVYETVLEAAREGGLSEDQIDQAVGRILTRKFALSQ